MLSEKEIKELVQDYGQQVNEGRTIRQIIQDGDLPRLECATLLEGKVSDSVFCEELVTKSGEPIRLMYRGNRISTHDQNRGEVPFKDQVLAYNHDHMLDLVQGVLGSSQFSVPDLKPTSTVIPAENLNLIKLENVLRLYMATSGTSTNMGNQYLNKGVRDFGGHHLPEGLVANCKLPYLMDTPSTKEESDRTVDQKYLFDNDICTQAQYDQIRNGSMMAFGIVTEYLRNKGMILVDTKTEHGINSKGQIVVADELYTMDSSRFWKLNDDGTIMNRNGVPVSFSKEFAREMIKEDGQMFTPEQTNEIAIRYIQGLQDLTGITFEPDLRPRDERIVESTNLILDYLI
jgi:phosphoribosylaminoimidazole-succinocarboxamide synthase